MYLLVFGPTGTFNKVSATTAEDDRPLRRFQLERQVGQSALK